MKNLISLCIALFLTINIFGQSRENVKTLTLKTESELLTEGSGFYFNKNLGKWIENKTALDENPVSKYLRGHVINFKSIQIVSFIFNNKSYYAILWIENSGSYRYPEIGEDWKDFNKTSFFIFDSLSYSKIVSNVVNKTGTNIFIKSKLYGEIDSSLTILGGEYAYNKQVLLAKMTTYLNGTKSNYTDNFFVLNCQVNDNIPVVRFKPISRYDAGFKSGKEWFTKPSEQSIKWDGEKYNDNYFEVSYDNFVKLIK